MSLDEYDLPDMMEDKQTSRLLKSIALLGTSPRDSKGFVHAVALASHTTRGRAFNRTRDCLDRWRKEFPSS
ncbi:hypothetical protein Q5752_001453 [Cryptotrichosporon argae]